MMTFEMFINFYNKCQTTNNDLNEFIFYSMNLCDLDNVIDEGNNRIKVNITALNENSNFTFNEDAVAVCIKTGWLSKYLSESWHYCPQFIKIILTNYCSNKILSKFIYLY
jgi:lysine/ornithine N-monooxygenase